MGHNGHGGSWSYGASWTINGAPWSDYCAPPMVPHEFSSCQVELLFIIPNPLTAKLFNLNFYPLEVVSRWRDPQLQVSENYSDLTNGGRLFSNIAGWCHILSLTCLTLIGASFYIPEIRINFPTTRGFKMKISMKVVYQYMAIFINFSPTLNHLHPLQVENCDSNSWLVVDEDDCGKLRPERVKKWYLLC